MKDIEETIRDNIRENRKYAVEIGLEKLAQQKIELHESLTDLVSQYSSANDYNLISDILLLLAKIDESDKRLEAYIPFLKNKAYAPNEIFEEYVLTQIKGDLDILDGKYLDKENALAVLKYPFHGNAAQSFSHFANILVRLHDNNILNSSTRSFVAQLVYRHADALAEALIKWKDLINQNIYRILESYFLQVKKIYSNQTFFYTSDDYLKVEQTFKNLKVLDVSTCKSSDELSKSITDIIAATMSNKPIKIYDKSEKSQPNENLMFTPTPTPTEPDVASESKLTKTDKDSFIHRMGKCITQ